MFTGIITEIGKIKSIVHKGSSVELTVACKDIISGVSPGDSVAVDGVCLSVTKKTNALTFDVVSNTLKNSNLKRLKINDPVNLEGALRLGEQISGHIVTGHVDGERKIRCNQKISEGWVLEVNILPGDSKYLIDKGSVALNGVSLPIGKVSRSFFRVFLIPHTIDNTVLRYKKSGECVNIEFDTMAKYRERSDPAVKMTKKDGKGVTKELLERKGFF